MIVFYFFLKCCLTYKFNFNLCNFIKNITLIICVLFFCYAVINYKSQNLPRISFIKTSFSKISSLKRNISIMRIDPAMPNNIIELCILILICRKILQNYIINSGSALKFAEFLRDSKFFQEIRRNVYWRVEEKKFYTKLRMFESWYPFFSNYTFFFRIL